MWKLLYVGEGDLVETSDKFSQFWILSFGATICEMDEIRELHEKIVFLKQLRWFNLYFDFNMERNRKKKWEEKW